MPEKTAWPDSREPAAEPGIEDLRKRLDAIDAQLLDRLRARIECCVEIGRVKRAEGIPMMQPHRIGVVQRRAADFADEHGLSRDFMHGFYELIIAETCRLEDAVIAGSTP
jgi:4-amino-4-deoxychorismate mutase